MPVSEVRPLSSRQVDKDIFGPKDPFSVPQPLQEVLDVPLLRSQGRLDRSRLGPVGGISTIINDRKCLMCGLRSEEST